MDPFVAVVVVVAIGAAVGWWLLRRNRQAPVEDEWVLPPESGTRLPAEPTAQVFDRDSLLRRDRSLDVSGWDDSPDLDEEAAEGPPANTPPVLDRDFLRRRADEGAGAGDDDAR